MATIAFKAPGEAIVLIGGHGTHLGRSTYLRECLGRDEGPPPPVDLAVELRNGDMVRSAIRHQRISACHDISNGGLAVTLAEMAMASGIGAVIDMPVSPDLHAHMFGEDQARYVLTVPQQHLERVLADAAARGVPAEVIGKTGGPALRIGTSLSISVETLHHAHEAWLPAYMAEQ